MRMPLSMAGLDETRCIRKIGGLPETRRFLENLGFTEGSAVKVVSASGGNLIVQVRESRVAISREMALKIHV